MDDSRQDAPPAPRPEDPVEAALRGLQADEPVPPLAGRVSEVIPARRFVGPEPWLRVIREG